MKTVWKFNLAMDDLNLLKIPSEYEILCIQKQHGNPCLWALVNPNSAKKDVLIRVAGTGHTINETIRKYIGTFQLYDGNLVFHVFEVC